MARVCTRVSRRIGEKQYFKSELAIPRSLMQQAQWSDSQEAKIELVDKNKILVTPIAPVVKSTKPSYESFSEEVVRILNQYPEGCEWSRIRDLSGRLPERPCALWAHRMEEEHGLMRIRNGKTSRVLWKLSS